jgi:hypothetical protein
VTAATFTCPRWCVEDHARDAPVDRVHRTGEISGLDVENTPAGFVAIGVEQCGDQRLLICLESSDAYLTRAEASRVATMLLDVVARLDEINGA